jgi:hypothetical protein
MALISDQIVPAATLPGASTHVLESSWLVAQVDDALLALPRAALVNVEGCALSPAPPWAAPWVGALALHHGSPVVALRLNGLAPANASASTQGLIAVMGDGTWGIWIDRLAGFSGGQPTQHDRRQPPASWPCPITFLTSFTLSDGRVAWMIDPAAISARLCAVL